jgi:hypothetical protein
VNLFGADVRALDVGAFLAAARAFFPLFVLGWLAAMLRFTRLRRPEWLLAGVLLANAWAWAETNWPLQRLYALGPSSDRVNNIAMCQSVAAGHSPLSTPQVGHLHFEPFWGLLTAVLSGYSPERLLRLYGFLPLLTACAFAISLYYALRPSRDAPDEPWSGWERALIAGAATLLSSAPLDPAGTYRVPWAMTFLLKPNHAVGLVLLPWVLRAFAGITGWRSRLAAGLLLHLMGWAFVIHMGATCIGLVVFVLLALVARRPDARRDAIDVAAVIGINLLVVSPYLVILLLGHAVFSENPRNQIPPWSPHFLEATARLGWMLPLAVWGGVVAWRRDRLGRAWTAQAVGALVLWLAFYPLSALSQAKERDDVFYWLRFLAAAMAAIGAWDLARRGARQLTGRAAEWLGTPHRRAAVLAALALPWALPYWWDPGRMDLYFPGSLAPLPPSVTEPAAALARAPAGVIAGDPGAARWIAALTGRKVILARDFPTAPDFRARLQLNEMLLRGDPGASAEAARFGVSHFVVTSAWLAESGLTLADLERNPSLAPVRVGHDADGSFTALFEVRS